MHVAPIRQLMQCSIFLYENTKSEKVVVLVNEGDCVLSEDKAVERWKRRRLLEAKKQWLAKKTQQAKKTEDSKKVLSRVLVGRAWEVLNAAERQYPKATHQVEDDLAHLVSTGKLKGPIDGEQLLWLFRRLGINVKLEIRIRILEHGELKTIEDKLKVKH